VRLAIPAYDLTNDDVYLFRTPHADFLRRDHREQMIDVALATTAAPTYLPAHRLRGLRLIDGGMWANNPVLIGIVEAVRVFGKPLSDIAVLSIGTTTEVAIRRHALDRGGLLAWANTAIPVVLRGQSVSARNFAHHILAEDALLRIDPLVPERALRLDGVTPHELRGRAEHVSRHVSTKVLEMFGRHIARPYVPLTG
jgi:patatin-like phospholipase/acyl hydrolase